jgi:DNA-binding MarR family transcriptional regulator
MTEEVHESCMVFSQHMQRFSMVFTAGMNNILGRGGINLPQYNTMTILRGHGNIKMGELARLLGVTMGAATNLADKLVNSGSVTRQRDNHDRRVVRLALTAKGKRQVQEIDETFVSFCTEVMGQLDPAVRGRFLQDFDAVLSLMQKHCGPFPENP